MFSRVFAFKDNIGTYYVYNDTKTSLEGISFNPSAPSYDNWMDITELESLTQEELKLVANLTLLIHSNLEEDSYKVTVDNFDIITTTNTSHFALRGYSTINKITIDGSTDCKVLLSFDNRQTWVYWNTSTNQWENSSLSNIYTNSMTVATANTLTSAHYTTKFTKSCTLDYAIAINTEQSFTSITLDLPSNKTPTITNITITSQADNQVHKTLVDIEADVNDLDDDDLTYEVTYIEGTETITLASGMVDREDGGKLYLTIDPNDMSVGTHVITIKVTDEANATASSTITLVRYNHTPTIAYTLNKNRLSVMVTDMESDDNVSYRLTLNSEVIQDWSEYSSSISDTMTLPQEYIIFSEQNTLLIEARDDVQPDMPSTQTVTFTGDYYGILFVDPSEPKYLTGTTKLNKFRYYSDTLEEIVKHLEIPSIYYNRESDSHQIGVINNSDSPLANITIRSEIDTDDYKLLVSDSQPFNYGQEFINISNIANDEEEPRIFYVKLVSYTNTTGLVAGDVRATETEE